jgi:hypothetical protein
MRQELQSALMQARTLAPEELPRLLGDLEEIRATALARLMGPAVESRPDEMLDVEQASVRMNLSFTSAFHSRGASDGNCFLVRLDSIPT